MCWGGKDETQPMQRSVNSWDASFLGYEAVAIGTSILIYGLSYVHEDSQLYLLDMDFMKRASHIYCRSESVDIHDDPKITNLK